ncbi:MAG: hypothetical protein KDA59_17710 [Planctomycetales bacterium]|nr:hypothetical protein [Planctomycetales bacterium]
MIWWNDATVTDLSTDEARVRAMRHGVIEVIAERFVGVHARPWPKLASLWEVGWLGKQSQRRATHNRCLLYFSQPRRMANFLTLKYIVSSPGTSLATFRGTLLVLDEIARIKRTDAIVCEVSHGRISDRLLERWGWQAHCPDSRRRHFIKRFYGEYPPRDPAWGDLTAVDSTAASSSERKEKRAGLVTESSPSKSGSE